jgi:5-methylcytosine-specific restriction endonuclease McrA
MAKKISKPGKIHLRIIETMRRFPLGITSGQIRQELEKEGLRPEDQTHLDRRKRDLKKWFVIRKIKRSELIDGRMRTVFLYTYEGERTDVTDEGSISDKDRAQVLHTSHGRCGMCGRTIERDGITLVVDHRIPRDWGGSNEVENLWAICEQCNGGKKAYFSSLDIDAELMKKVMHHRSVHVRIGELLKATGIGKPVRSVLLGIAADQDDWQKRLRELRYPVIGWKIDTKLYKLASGKKQADYILRSFRAWPDDPSGTIRRFEEERRRKNKSKRTGR